jgi:hypothetical protein
MKTIFLALIALGLCAQAQSRTLSTTDGATYTGITTQRIEPDGLYIEYTLPGGGLGMSKIKFDRLSRVQQKQYGFDADAARDYEAEVAQANEDCSQELIHRAQIERDARHDRDLENERAYSARMTAIAQLNAAQSAAFYSSCKSTIDGHGGGLSYGTEATTGPGPLTQTSYSSGLSADTFPNRGITTRSH